MTLRISLFLPMLLLAVVPAAAQNWMPDPIAVAMIEAMVTIPEGAHPRDAYDRTYYGVTLNGNRRIIEGQYLLAGKGGRAREPGLRLVQDPPLTVMGGGCMVLRVEYDVAAKALSARCNPAR